MNLKKLLALGLSLTMATALLAGCGSTNDTSADAGSAGESGDTSAEQVVIYSNADEEAITAMENALDSNGYEGQYVFQTFGTSELGGRLLAEGTTLEEVPDYTAPITSQEGAIIVNTEMLAENNLPMPTCLKDLADPAYAGFVAVTDVQSSSTAWLLMQALVSEYGEEEAQNILHDIYVNAGDHVESSGSAPLQLCEAGEVAVGFGLRHQAVAAKNDGLPIDYVDPTEGNFSLTESVAVLDKGDATNPLAMEMAQCIIENGRAELQQNYPNPLYEGESADNANKSAYPKTFSEPLTFELYEHHIEISEAAKP